MIEIAEKCEAVKQKEVETHKLDINNEISRISQWAENWLKSLWVKPEDIKHFNDDFKTNLEHVKKGLFAKVDTLGCWNLNPLEIKQKITAKQVELKNINNQIEEESSKYRAALIEEVQKQLPWANNYLILQTVGSKMKSEEWLKDKELLSWLYRKSDVIRSEIDELNTKLKWAESFSEDKKVFMKQMIELSTLFGDKSKLDDLIDVDWDNWLFTRGLSAVSFWLYGIDKTWVDISDWTKRKKLISDI